MYGFRVKRYDDLSSVGSLYNDYDVVYEIIGCHGPTTNHQLLLRRRRCFEMAKPRRSAGGAQLNRSLGELEGPIRDPVLARFPKVAAFSSAESGSGEPPDRAQICAMMLKPF